MQTVEDHAIVATAANGKVKVYGSGSYSRIRLMDTIHNRPITLLVSARSATRVNASRIIGSVTGSGAATR